MKKDLHTEHIEHMEHIADHDDNSRAKRPKLKKIIKIVGLLIFILAAILLGNITGRYLFSKKSDVVKKDKIETVRSGQSNLPRPPSTDSSEEEKEAFSQKVFNLSKVTNIIEITAGCALSPEVTRVKEGEPLTFENNDTESHGVNIFKEEARIPAKDKRTVSAQFANGPGTYGIRCDTNDSAGFLVVDQP